MRSVFVISIRAHLSLKCTYVSLENPRKGFALFGRGPAEVYGARRVASTVTILSSRVAADTRQ